MKKKSHNLSILLIKSNISSAVDALKNVGTLNKCDVPIAGKTSFLFHKQNPAHAPSWIKLFRPYVGSSLDSLNNSGNAAVLLIEQSHRFFAITFGYGKSLLKPDSYEENFGLKVVLNTVNPEKLRSVDAQSLEAVPVQVRSQASVATSLSEFGFDIERDLIYAATGQPKDSALGKQITGKDAIKLTVALELSDLSALLNKLLGQFSATTYKDNFAWIDNLSEVRDPTLLAGLDAALGAKIQSEDFSRTWLAIPDIIEWPDLLGFKYQRPKQGMLLDDIDWPSYLEFIGNDTPRSVETFRRHSVLCMSASSEQPVHDWSVYKCIYCELDLHGHGYALTNGKWYRVDANFLSTLNSVVKAIPTSTLALPDYMDKTEADYNVRVHKGANGYFAFMDKKMIQYGGGSSKIEFCDLFTKDNHLVHVKRYGGSSVLSHLFAQGLISARLLLSDAEFRLEVNKKLPASHLLGKPRSKPDPSGFEVVYAVASNKSTTSFELLLFSKINLRNSYRQLQLVNMKASITVVAAKEIEQHENEGE